MTHVTDATGARASGEADAASAAERVRDAARYRSLVEATADVVWRTDSRGRAIDLGRWPALFGTPRDDPEGYAWSTVIHPDDLPRMQAEWRAALRERRPYAAIYRLRLPDGRYRRFRTRGVPILGDDGRVAEWVGVASDVEDRLAAEEALRASEARYRTLVEATAQMIWHVGPDGLARGGFAEQWSAFTGVPVTPESPTDVWLAPVHPHDRARIGEAWVEARASGTPYELDYRVRAADGTWRAMHVRALPMRAPDGTVVEWVGTHTDVTERDAARAALERERALLAESQRIGQLGSWSWAMDTGETWVSDEVYRIFGVDPAEVRAFGGNAIEAFDALLDRDDRARSAAKRRAVFAQRATASSGQWRVTRPDGRRIVVVTRSEWRYDDGGRPVYASGTVQDVTEQVAADEALRASEERFRLASRATRDALYEFDVANGMVWAADTLRAMFRMDADVTTAHGWWRSAVHPDDRARVFAALEAALADGRDTCVNEYRIRRGDGTWATVIDRGYLVRDETGRPVRIVGAVADVSEQRELEAQLRQAQKMEAVGQLAGGVAHDFNNLLSVILASAELSRGAAQPGSVLAADLDEIVRAARRGAQLTRQLLAFSRRQVLRPRLLDLAEVVRGTEPLLRRLLPEHVALDLALAATPAVVHADPGQIEQVLMNLVVNARDAIVAAESAGGRAGGLVQIAVDTVRVDGAGELPDGGGRGPGPLDPGSYVRMRVHDDGVGIDAETRARVFEPFFTTKAPGQGTGLGLSTAYGIATQSGGTILVESAPGSGATFSVLLPSAGADAPSPDAAHATPRAPAAGRETVLVAEDEAAVRRMVRRVLERHGYRVLEARHGADALLLWDEHRGSVDVVLTDLRMPEMGGHELIDRLRARRPDLPAVLMSGYVRESDGRGPAVRALDKPFAPEELLGAIRAALDERVGR